MAIRGYWVGGRGWRGRGSGRGGACRNPGQGEETMANEVNKSQDDPGKKRKCDHEEDEEDINPPSPKTMRTTSPQVKPSSNAPEKGNTSGASEIYSPPSERDNTADEASLLAPGARPEAPEGANEVMELAMEVAAEIGHDPRPGPPGASATPAQAEGGAAAAEPGPARRYLNQQTTVHLIFPLDDVRVPPYLRRGFRPIHPYPFTGQVARANREEVRRTLELDWRAEAAGISDATDIGIAALMQIRALWYWEGGWRRSRFTGQWGFYGDSNDEDHQGYLNAESQVRGPLREEADRRILRMTREETELRRSGGPVMAETVARFIWDRLQLIRRAYGNIGVPEMNNLFRFQGEWPLNATGANGPINTANNLPGPPPGGLQPGQAMVQPEELPLHTAGRRAVARRLEAELNHQEYLVRQGQRMVDQSTRMLRHAADLNLEEARGRAEAELEVGRANLRVAELNRERARHRLNNLERHPNAWRPEPLREIREEAPLVPRAGPQPRLNGERGRARGKGKGRGGRGGRGRGNWHRGGDQDRTEQDRRPRDQEPAEAREPREPREHSDTWRQLQAQKVALPALHEWRRRVRVAELQLMETHPQRDLIRRVIEGEEAIAVADAKALVRSQELTGAVTSFDIAWPPSKSVTIKMGKRGRDLEVSSSDEDDQERPGGRYFGAIPPPNCGYGKFGRGFRGGRGGRGGHGGAHNLVGH